MRLGEVVVLGATETVPPGTPDPITGCERFEEVTDIGLFCRDIEFFNVGSYY